MCSSDPHEDLVAASLNLLVLFYFILFWFYVFSSKLGCQPGSARVRVHGRLVVVAKMYRSSSLRYESSHRDFSLRGESDEDYLDISLEDDRGWCKPSPGTHRITSDNYFPRWECNMLQ